MTHRNRQIGGTALTILATVIALSEVALRIYAAIYVRQYSPSYVMLSIAVVIGFTGLYTLDPSRAKDGGRFLVDNAIRVIQVLRIGRRKDDPLAVVVADQNGNTAEIAVPTIAANDEQPLPKPEDVPVRRVTDKPIDGGNTHGTGD